MYLWPNLQEGAILHIVQIHRNRGLKYSINRSLAMAKVVPDKSHPLSSIELIEQTDTTWNKGILICCFQYCITGGSNSGLQIQARNGGKNANLKQGESCLSTGSTFWSLFSLAESTRTVPAMPQWHQIGFTGLKSNRHGKQTQEEIKSLNSFAKLNMCSDCSIRVVTKLLIFLPTFLRAIPLLDFYA